MSGDTPSCSVLSFGSCSDQAAPLLPASVDSGRFQHLAAAQQDFLLHHSGAANAGIILDSKRESARKNEDRIWGLWTLFCAKASLNSDPFLSQLQQRETELVMRSFQSLH